MNWLLPAAAAFLILPSLPVAARDNGVGLPWGWPWTRGQNKALTTIVHPNPKSIIQRDHSVAEREFRSEQQRARVIYERQHRAQLQGYVQARLELAEERARWQVLRAEQISRSSVSSSDDSAVGQPASAASAASMATSAAGAWTLSSSQNKTSTQQRPASQGIADQVSHIANELPKRTRQVIAGTDELVVSTMDHGLSRGLAIFLALLMLHIPSLALAALVVGVILIRGHRKRSGSLCLALAVMLGAVVFLVLPW